MSNQKCALERLKARTKGSPQCLMLGDVGELSRKWNLYISADFEEKLRGTYSKPPSFGFDKADVEDSGKTGSACKVTVLILGLSLCL